MLRKMVKPNQVTLRFETKKQTELLRRAAKRADMSVNKYAIRLLNRQVEADLQTPPPPTESQNGE